MTEVERLKIVKIIDKIQSERKTYHEVRSLLNDPPSSMTIGEYRDLSKRYAALIEYHENWDDSLEKNIYLAFLRAVHGTLDGVKTTKCDDGIWVYRGSYYTDCDIRCEHEHEYSTENEYTNDFEYNRYCCLDTGRSVNVEDWEEFERTHTVLKDYSAKNSSDFYQNRYYQLLYGNSVGASRERIKKEFARGAHRNMRQSRNRRNRQVVKTYNAS